jgi:hypothetical protein
VAGGGPALTLLEALLYPLAIIAIEPFYVAGGFALYVNRRIWLEGWDIDLIFPSSNSAWPRSRCAWRTRALTLGLLRSRSVPPLARGGEEPAPPPRAAMRPGPQARRVHRCGARERGVRDGREGGGVAAEDERAGGRRRAESAARLGLWLASVGATLLRVVAWLALAGVIAALAIAIVRSLRDRDARANAPLEEVGAVRVGVDLRRRDCRPTSSPRRVPASRAATRGSAPLLYRGASCISCAASGSRCPRATEGECERIARAALEAGLAGDFRDLTRALFCAYAHQTPAPDAFAELSALAAALRVAA